MAYIWDYVVRDLHESEIAPILVIGEDTQSIAENSFDTLQRGSNH